MYLLKNVGFDVVNEQQLKKLGSCQFVFCEWTVHELSRRQSTVILHARPAQKRIASSLPKNTTVTLTQSSIRYTSKGVTLTSHSHRLIADQCDGLNCSAAETENGKFWSQSLRRNGRIRQVQSSGLKNKSSGLLCSETTCAFVSKLA